jgi:hypothetical protein
MSGDDFESVRAELRRRGYLQHGVERFLLQDALRPRAAVAVVVRLALRVGLLLGILGAMVGGAALALVNGGLRAHPADAALLSLHLLLPAVAATALGFLAIAAPFALAFRSSRRAGELLALGLAIAASAAWLLLVAVRGRALLAGSSRLLVLGLVLGAIAVAWMLGRVLYDGLLALAARFSRLEPGGFALPRWALGLLAVVGGVGLLLPALLAADAAPPPSAPVLPTAPGDRVLLIGVDGVLAQELDYLLARGDLAAISGRLLEGGAVLRYPRPAGPPASLWTSVATGLEPAAHGVVGVDSYRPLGVAVPLVRSGPWRSLWRVETALGLCEYRPVLAARRKGWTVWELAARGGGPVAAVDWWATFPAEPSPGLIVAHGAYRLLGERAPGAVEPAGLADELEALRRGDAARALDAQVGSALPAPAAQSLLERAVRPDLFYFAALRRALPQAPRAAALYLPGLDIAAADWAGSDVAFGDLVRSVLVEVDRLVGEGAGFGTVAIVADPGRRGGTEGRVLMLRRGCSGESATRPEAVASSLLRALGLPQSAELPPPVEVCDWPAPPSTVPTYGLRRAAGTSASAGEEYLENLKALGYL